MHWKKYTNLLKGRASYPPLNKNENLFECKTHVSIPLFLLRYKYTSGADGGGRGRGWSLSKNSILPLSGREHACYRSVHEFRNVLPEIWGCNFLPHKYHSNLGFCSIYISIRWNISSQEVPSILKIYQISVVFIVLLEYRTPQVGYVWTRSFRFLTSLCTTVFIIQYEHYRSRVTIQDWLENEIAKIT